MRHALRGATLSFHRDPFLHDPESSYTYEPDALVIIDQGRIEACGPYRALADRIEPETPVTQYAKHELIVPGFIDSHVHYVQMPIIGAYGTQLIDWLERYAFVAEQRSADPAVAAATARAFLTECLRNGSTTGAVYCSVYPQSVDAFFTEAERLGMRMIAGKVLMDRNAPEVLRDTPQRGYDESEQLIARWHGQGRALYAITPRFAPTSSPEQMELAGALWQAHPGTYLQTHLSETHQELAWVHALYSERSDYLDVYDHYGQLGPRAIFGHGIHLSEREMQRLHESGSAIAHCPTSNEFLASGACRVHELKDARRPVRIGLATDLAGGSSFSPFETMLAAYRAAQVNGHSLSPLHAWYLATRGAAETLYLEDTIGSIAPGFEADLAVLDLASTPLIAGRLAECASLADQLFVQIVLADDRAIRATWVAGELRHDRGNAA